MIRTKIISTLGPASCEIDVIRKLAEAGVDVFRINFSHGDNEQRKSLLDNIRAVEAELGEPLGVLGDLCGPKIRVRQMADEGAKLEDGNTLVIQREYMEGTADRISTTLEELSREVSVGESVLLDDGKIRLEVIEVLPPDEVVCKVIRGGILFSGKGMNLPQTDLKIPALTAKDRRDAAWIAQHEFDYVALSFVQRASDIDDLRKLLIEAGSDAHIIAKIEKPSAVDDIEAIVTTADAVMVARGDLGVEMDLAVLPVVQKRIASICRLEGKPCIIATQMLESMTTAAMPTRAEVSDVANAVLDYADAVMLSGETAVGLYPVQAVAMMNEIVAQTQGYHDRQDSQRQQYFRETGTEMALASAVRRLTSLEEIAAVAVLTMTGSTARIFSKQRPPCPILGLSPNVGALRKMTLYYGVLCAQTTVMEHTGDVLRMAAEFAEKCGVAKKGEQVIVVSGRPLGKSGQTNTLVIHTIE